jgi:serine/threonine protein kinase
MDFGVALVAFRTTQTTPGTIKGTLRYLSPEQAEGSRAIGPATDQFALGLVLCEMLTGEPVYDGDHEHKILLKAMKGEVEPAVRLAEKVLPGVGPIIARALALKSGDRFSSVGDFVNALETLAASFSGDSVDLALLVHHALEERARLAVEESEDWGTETSIRNLFGPDEESSRPGHLRNDLVSQPLGWASEQLSAISGQPLEDENPDLPFQALEEETGEEVTGWDPGASDRREKVTLEPGQENEEGWAILPSTSSQALRLIENEDTDEDIWESQWLKKGESPSGDHEEDVSAEAGSYSTSYAVRHPGRDLVGPAREPKPSKNDTTVFEFVVGEEESDEDDSGQSKVDEFFHKLVGSGRRRS